MICKCLIYRSCLKFPARLRNIERWAFGGTTNLSNVTFNDSLVCIDAQVFQGSGIVSATLPNSLTYIGGGAFASCPQLKDVHIGSGLKYFAESENKSSPVNPFIGSRNLTTITIDQANPRFTAIDNVVYNKQITDLYFPAPGLRSMIVPNTVTSFVTTAFSYGEMENITLPQNLMVMWGGYSFEGAKISTLNIPETLVILESGQFFGSSFTDLYFNSPTPCTISEDDVKSFLPNTTIHVPIGCAEIYRNSGYSHCKEIIEDLPTPEREVLQFRFSDYLQNPYAYATLSGAGEVAIIMEKDEINAYKGQSIASVAAETAFGTEIYAFVCDKNGNYLTKTDTISVFNNGIKAIRFNEPYVITGEEESLVIGIGSQNGIGIEHSHTTVPNRFAIRGSSADNWTAIDVTYRLACFLEGKDFPTDLRIIESGKVVVEENDSTIILPTSTKQDKMYVSAMVQNSSNVPVKSYTLSYTINGVDTLTTTVDTYMLPNETKIDTIAIALPQAPGKYTIDMVITKVNDEYDAIPSNGVAQQEALVRAATYQRNAVMEMGVATWCHNSLRGYDGVTQMEDKYLNRFVPIALHVDEYMPVNNNSYHFLDQRIKATPKAFMNRDYDNSFDPNFEELDKRFSTITADYASAQIIGEARFAREDNSKVYVSCEINFDITATDNYAVGYVLVEDSVGPYDQWNGWEYQPMLFNNVARDVIGGEYGLENSLPSTILTSETYSHSASINISNVVQNVKNCEVVAMVINTTTGDIENACKMEIQPYDTSSINDISTTETLTIYVENRQIVANVDCEGLKVYTTDGRMVENKNLASGIYIVNALHNGVIHRQKVMVR